MKKFAGLALGLATLIVPGAARAQVTELRCAGSTIAGTLTCVTARFVLSGTDLKVYLFNGSTADSKVIASSLQGFGVFNLDSYGGAWSLSSAIWNNYVGTGGVASGDVSADWTIATSLPGVGVTFNDGADASGNGGLVTCAGPSGGSGTNYMTCDGSPGPTFAGNEDWMVFTLGHTGGNALDIAALTTLEWGFKAQRVGTANVSLECVSNAAVGTTTYCSDTPGTPQEVVPEPATMSLLAMGLAGMAAASRRRRKQQ